MPGGKRGTRYESAWQDGTWHDSHRRQRLDHVAPRGGADGHSPVRRGVVKPYLPTRLKAVLSAALLGSLMAASGAFLTPAPAFAAEAATDRAQPPTTLTISEALSRHLAGLKGEHGIEWPHTFVATRQAREHSRQLGRRLFFELRQLSSQAVFDERLPAAGLKHWMQIVKRTPIGGRQVGRIDPIALWRFPRLDIPLSTHDWIGQCQPETRLQLWSAVGVRQLDWRPELTLREAIAGLPGARTSAESASVITLSGRVIERGISAWNEQPYTLAPGDRVVIHLPRLSPSAAWVNRSLPEWLSLQWPGKACRSLDAITGQPQAPEYLLSLRELDASPEAAEAKAPEGTAEAKVAADNAPADASAPASDESETP